MCSLVCTRPRLHSTRDTSWCSLLMRPVCRTEAFQTPRALASRGPGKLAATEAPAMCALAGPTAPKHQTSVGVPWQLAPVSIPSFGPLVLLCPDRQHHMCVCSRKYAQLPTLRTCCTVSCIRSETMHLNATTHCRRCPGTHNSTVPNKQPPLDEVRLICNKSARMIHIWLQARRSRQKWPSVSQ